MIRGNAAMGGWLAGAAGYRSPAWDLSPHAWSSCCSTASPTPAA